MTHSETILAIDVGTQSTRAIAFTAEGQIVDFAQIVYPAPYHSSLPGWAEQAPESYWGWVFGRVGLCDSRREGTHRKEKRCKGTGSLCLRWRLPEQASYADYCGCFRVTSL